MKSFIEVFYICAALKIDTHNSNNVFEEISLFIWFINYDDKASWKKSDNLINIYERFI